MVKYVFAVLAILFIVIGGGFLAFSDPPAKQAQEEKKKVSLLDYADSSAVVSFTMYGRLVGEEQRRGIRVSVSPYKRTVEIIEGYTGKVTKSQSLPNNSEAYDAFIHALSYAGFIKSQEALFDSEKGVCPTGNISIYQLQDNNDQVSRLWSSSCSSKSGSLSSASRSSSIKSLFQKQIPNYSEFVRGVRF